MIETVSPFRRQGRRHHETKSLLPLLSIRRLVTFARRRPRSGVVPNLIRRMLDAGHRDRRRDGLTHKTSTVATQRRDIVIAIARVGQLTTPMRRHPQSGVVPNLIRRLVGCRKSCPTPSQRRAQDVNGRDTPTGHRHRRCHLCLNSRFRLRPRSHERLWLRCACSESARQRRAVPGTPTRMPGVPELWS